MSADHIREDRLKDLLCRMVDIYSPSGKEEELVAFLADYLEHQGLPVTLREVTEGRFNVEVVAAGSDPDTAFCGHIDTVPAYDIERYESDERDGQIFGLGTADMKAGCAAMVEAFVAFAESGSLPQRSGLFLVVGEEEVGDGTQALLSERNFSSAIVAEPTGLRPCLSHYGYIEMLVRAFGTRRHASMAGREYNAIFAMLRMLLRMGGVLEADYPEAILNIRDLHSSESGFAVPDRCEAWVDLHIPPRTDPKRFAEELEQLAGDSLTGSAVNGHAIEFPSLFRGYRLEETAPFPSLVERVFLSQGMDWSPGAFKSHSDASLMRQAGCDPVVLGPGHLAKAHTRDESVPIDQVVTSSRLFFELLRAVDTENERP